MKKPSCFFNFVTIFGDFFYLYKLSRHVAETLLACLVILLDIGESQGNELVTIVVIYIHTIFLKLIVLILYIYFNSSCQKLD